ncbi:MAG: phosphoribosylamine--glycine ligase [Myxococcota bacterium]|nr:phosphoribosylamine--glycine ligase [Myxococcota bacterium]
MRVLGIGDSNDLGALYLRLIAGGHDVRVHVGHRESRDVLEGMLRQSVAWRDELPWVGADPEGVIVFEDTGWGESQDALRRDGFRVVGGSAVGDRLELDRAYAQRVLGEVGIRTARTYEFEGFESGLKFLASRGGRFVLKYSGDGFASTRNYVGASDTGEDMMAVLRLHRARWTYDEIPRYVLMEYVRGVEVGVGAFFDGNAFVGPPNIDFEHKRFFPGDVGELTGEMGTLVSYRGAEPLFDATLRRVVPLLREARHVGYVNLNAIVNEDGVWPLEFTCRFGYPGFAILSALQVDSWDAILSRLCDGGGAGIKTHSGFAVGVVLTVPPFPYPDGYERLSKGVPIFFRPDLDEEDRDALHYGEVRLEAGQLVTAGQIGYVMVVTGRGDTVAQARSAAYDRVEKVLIPNVRYRVDIGARFERQDRAELVRLGWLDA